MFGIDDPTAVTIAPTVPAVTGAGEGFFSNGNPASGQAATIVPDWWLNMIQGELRNVVTQAGITPVKGQNTQLQDALVKQFGGSSQLYPNGWAQLPGGMILQWASGVTAFGNGDTVYFPTPFKNNLFSINITDNNPSAWSTGAASLFPTAWGWGRLGAAPLAGFSLWGAKMQFNMNWGWSNLLQYSYIAIGN